MNENLLLDYFKSIADRQGKYHDHKEVSAWAGLVLHLVFCGALLRIDAPAKNPTLTFTIATIAVAVAALFAFFYIREQLRLKDLGGAMLGAATYYMSKMVTSADGKLDEVLTPLEQSTDQDTQASHMFPASLLKKRDWMNTQGLGAQRATRRYIYGLLVTATLFVVAFNAVRLCG